MDHVKTRADEWHEQASAHPVLEGSIMVIAVFIAFLMFTVFGYFRVAIAYPGGQSDTERFELSEKNPDDIFETRSQHRRIQSTKSVMVEEVPDGPGADVVDEGLWEEPWDPVVSIPAETGGGDYVSDFKTAGVGSDGEHYYSWYSQNVLPGDGLDELNANGRHVGENGFVVDGDDYIAVAMDGVDIGTVVSTPWGDAKVYDHIEDGNGEYTGHVDVYTDY